MAQLTAATYNVYLGADLMKIFAASSPSQLHALAAEVYDDLAATDFPQRARGIASALGSVGFPDLVGTQETSVWATGRPGAEPVPRLDFTAELLAAFAEAGAPYDVVASSPNFGGRMPVAEDLEVDLRGHNVTFARRDRVQVTGAEGGAFDARLEVATEMPGVSFDIVRSWTTTTLEVEGGVVQLANTHLETYDAGVRTAQLGELLGRLASGPAVVLGDFNERPAQLRMPPGWVDAWVVAHGPDGGFTCGDADPLLRHRASHLDHRIDYVMVRGAAVADCVLVGEAPMASGLWPSDHAGVVATLVLPDQGPG